MDDLERLSAKERKGAGQGCSESEVRGQLYRRRIHCRVRPWHGATTERFFEANWKLAIEGGIEDYHLPWVHPQAGNGEGVVWTPRIEWDARHYVGVTGKIAREGDGPVVIDSRRAAIFGDETPIRALEEFLVKARGSGHA